MICLLIFDTNQDTWQKDGKWEEQQLNNVFENLTGKILVSVPSILDLRFEKSVIFVCGHDDNGAIGLIINKLMTRLTFKELLAQLKIEDVNLKNHVPIHAGGPVEVGRGFVLHTSDFYHQTTVKITNDLYLTATTDILKSIAEGVGPEKFIFTLGYSGWASGQLEKEMQTNTWVQAHPTLDLIFSADLDSMWDNMMSNLGIKNSFFSCDLGHA